MMVEASEEGPQKQREGEGEGEGRPSSNKGKKRQKKSSGAVPTVVQRLYETCKDAFDGAGTGTGTVPSHADVSRIRSILDSMKPEDVGLSQNLPFWGNTEPGEAPRITYLPIYEGFQFSIVIFGLPPSGVIPLHNHPGMTVFSKLLVGSMHIKSYDWVDVPQNFGGTPGRSHPQHPGRWLAKVKTDAVFTTPCETSILYPADGGNMHCFTAKTTCAVLDVLGPPYSNADGRHCQYYSDFPCSSSSGDAAAAMVAGKEGEYAWLEEKLDNFFVVGGKYEGSKVVEI